MVANPINFYLRNIKLLFAQTVRRTGLQAACVLRSASHASLIAAPNNAREVTACSVCNGAVVAGGIRDGD